MEKEVTEQISKIYLTHCVAGSYRKLGLHQWEVVALDCLVVPPHPPHQNDGLFHTFLDNWNKIKQK